MLHHFLKEKRAQIIERCRAKVAGRGAPQATAREMEHGIPHFLDQLIETLRHEHASGPQGATSRRDISSEIAATATKHGHELLQRGFSVHQVVHDYGDLCQAVTDLASESGAAVTVDEFRTLNRCLDNAIADAVTEFDLQRDRLISDNGNAAMGERLGSLAHEMRNFLNTATLAFAAIKTGRVAAAGATSAVVDRSLDGLRDLVDRALADVRLVNHLQPQVQDFPLVPFIEAIQVSAGLEATARHCGFTVTCEPADLAVRGDRQLLFSALSNLLQNAFKFTRPGTHVRLHAYGAGARALIEVQDQCGGLAPGKAEDMFRAFEQHGEDRSGLGLGLSIARRAVEGSGGTVRVRDIPKVGCVFTIDLPRCALRSRPLEAAQDLPTRFSA